MAPLAMRNTRLYPIWPAAPVTATRTGCFSKDVMASTLRGRQEALRSGGEGGVGHDRDHRVTLDACALEHDGTPRERAQEADRGGVLGEDVRDEGVDPARRRDGREPVQEERPEALPLPRVLDEHRDLRLGRAVSNAVV